MRLPLVMAVAVVTGGMAWADEMPPPGALEGRPSGAEVSPLQARVDATAPGGTLDVGPGVYPGDLLLDRPIRLRGHGRPKIGRAHV